MTLTQQAEAVRKEVLAATRGTELQYLVLKALSLTMAEAFDKAFDEGWESAMGELAVLKAGSHGVT
jgi:hypothetical protein